MSFFKKKKKESIFDDLGAFGLMVNALTGGGDTGNIFPKSDANDFRMGAKYIPDEVTTARRNGKTVTFYPLEHKWQMPDGSFVS
jgi:hypothetical protein